MQEELEKIKRSLTEIHVRSEERWKILTEKMEKFEFYMVKVYDKFEDHMKNDQEKKEHILFQARAYSNKLLSITLAVITATLGLLAFIFKVTMK